MAKANRIAFLFPGQGAQHPGMGRDFYDHFAEARECFQEGNERLQRDLTSILFDGPAEALTETQNSQTGIYLVSCAILRTLHTQFPDLKPAFVAGHSLGEYSALTASNRLAFDHGLPLVQQRGTFMAEACRKQKGAMAAVIGLDAAAVRAALEGLEGVWAANFNCPGQVVISCTVPGLDRATASLKAAGARRILPLQVHGAFHSPLMAGAGERLADEIDAAPFEDSEIGIVMNVPGKVVADPVQATLKKQMTSPVLWEDSIQTLIGEGVDLFVEIGAGRVLSGLNKRMNLPVPTLNVEKVADLEKLQESVG